MPKPNGDAGDALDWALDHIDDPMASVRFLDDWRLGDLAEWPEYLSWVKYQQACAGKAKEDKMERLIAVLNPFAAMGRVMENRARVSFGQVIPDQEIVCASSGEIGTGVLTMGHFRDAVALLPKAPPWTGIYRQPFEREGIET